MTEEPDPLRGLFEELRASALPSMRPLGVDGVVGTVAHRRRVRAGAAAVAVVLVAGLAAGALGYRRISPSPPPPVSASGTPSPLPSASVVPPSPSISARSGMQHSGGPARSAGSPNSGVATTNRATCAHDGIAALAGSAGLTYDLRFATLSGRSAHPCAGVTVPVFWASYSVNPDGSGTLYEAGTATLSASRTLIPLHVDAPATCGAWFVGFDATVPATLASVQAALAGAGSPFQDTRHHRDGTVIRSSDDCPTEAPSGPPSPEGTPPSP